MHFRLPLVGLWRIRVMMGLSAHLAELLVALQLIQPLPQLSRLLEREHLNDLWRLESLGDGSLGRELHCAQLIHQCDIARHHTGDSGVELFELLQGLGLRSLVLAWFELLSFLPLNSKAIYI